MTEPRKSAFTSSDSDDDRLGRFVAGSSAAMLASVISGFLQFLWTILMTRTVGPAGFGILGPFVNAYFLVAALATMGVPQAVITFTAHNWNDDPDAARDIMAQGSSLLLLLMGVVVALAVIVGGGLYFAGVLSSFGWALILALAVGVIARHTYYAAFGAFAGIQRMDLVAATNALPPIALLGVSAAFSVWLSPRFVHHFNRHVFLFITPVIVTAFVASGVAALMSRKAGLPVGLFYRFPKPTRWAELMRFGWSANVAYVGVSILTAFTPTVVAFMARALHWFGPTPAANADSAGFFSTAYVYAMAPLLIIGLTFALVPAASEADAAGNKPLLQKYFDLSLRYCLTLIWMLMAVYFVFGGFIVQTFSGPRYPAAMMSPLTGTLALAVGASSFYLLMTNLLTGLKRPVIPSRVSFVLLIGQWALFAAAGMLTHSLLALAVVFAGVMIAGSLFLLGYSRVKIGLLVRPALALRPMLVAIIVALAASHILPQSHLGLALGLPAIMAVYGLLVALLGGIDGDDFTLIRSTLQSARVGFLVPLINLAERLVRLSPLFPKNAEN